MITIRAKNVDAAIDDLVAYAGFKCVLAALCRNVHRSGMNPVIFRRLNKVYEWLTEYDEKKEKTK